MQQQCLFYSHPAWSICVASGLCCIVVVLFFFLVVMVGCQIALTCGMPVIAVQPLLVGQNPFQGTLCVPA